MDKQHHQKKRLFSELNEDDDFLHNHNHSPLPHHPKKRRKLSEPSDLNASDYCETHYALNIIHSIPSNPTEQQKQDIITKIDTTTAAIDTTKTMLTNLSIPCNEVHYLNQALSELHLLKQDLIENVNPSSALDTISTSNSMVMHDKMKDLIAMGFDRNQCQEAIASHTHNVSIGVLIDYLFTHSVSDQDTDTTDTIDTIDDTPYRFATKSKSPTPTEQIYTLEHDVDIKMNDNHNAMDVDIKQTDDDIDKLHKLSSKWVCFCCKNRWSLRGIEFHLNFPICPSCDGHSIRIMFDIKTERWLCPQCIHDAHLYLALNDVKRSESVNDGVWYIQIKKREHYELFRIIQFVDNTIKIQRVKGNQVVEERIDSDKDMIWSYCSLQRIASSLKTCEVAKIPIKPNKERATNDNQISIKRKDTKDHIDINIDYIRHTNKWIDYIMNIKRKELRKKDECLHEDYLILTTKYEKYKQHKKNEKNKQKEEMNIIESAPMNSRHFTSQNVSKQSPQRMNVSRRWPCIKCTFINKASSTNCEICEYANENAMNQDESEDITTQIMDELDDNQHRMAPQRDINLSQISQHPLVLILGASGSGKSTILRSLHSAFPELITFCDPMELKWNNHKAIISQFDDMETEAIIDIMSSIGLNSVPTWLKPFHILSQGEQYRAAMSRLLMQSLQRQNQWTIMDEYSSVIDRKTARCMSAAFSKYLRKNQNKEIGSFILASTNKDIIRWLQPDVVILLQDDDKYRILKNPNDLRDPTAYAPDIKVILDLAPFNVLKQTAKYPLSRDLKFDELKLCEEALFLGDKVRRLQCKIDIDLNVEEVANILDVNNFDGEIVTDIPCLEEKHIGNQWRIGVICGPSGSGKTASGERLFGRPMEIEWKEDINICSHFESFVEFKEKFEAVGLHISKGLCTFHQLSKGEQHRANIARLLDKDNVIIDEFTSYLNRDLSKFIAMNINEYIHRHNNKGVVFLSCHYDVISYLKPDWLFDVQNKKVLHFESNINPQRRIQSMKMEPFDVDSDCFNRAKIRIYLKHGQWKDFKSTFSKYHYMNQNIQYNCMAFTCWARFGYDGDEDDGDIDDSELELVGFVSILNNFMNTKFVEWREHRTVILPSFQGMGFGSRISDAVGEYLSRNGIVMHSKTAHPRYGMYRDRSVLWKATSANHVVESRIGLKSQSDRALLGNKRIKDKEETKKMFYSHRFVSHLDRSEDAQFYLDQRVIVKGEY